jgi:hypothetical protein
VESISSVDVLCTDKTGTPTSGRLTVTGVEVLGGHEVVDVERWLGSAARSATDTSSTSATAIAAALPGQVWDRRPSLLVLALLVAFVGVLYTPLLSDYFGLTGPNRLLLIAVLPALVIWFVALTAAFRGRLLDRLLGLDSIPSRRRARSGPAGR